MNVVSPCSLELPELNDMEREAMYLIPDDAVNHWLRGEKMDFRVREWEAESFDSPRPDEYEFEYASGCGGVTNVEFFRCPSCRCRVKFVK